MKQQSVPVESSRHICRKESDPEPEKAVDPGQRRSGRWLVAAPVVDGWK